MKKKNGFISMSLVYSFFVVFIAISASLLTMYSSNISVIKKLNREIKEDLRKKGNEDLVVMRNMLKNGSFEEESSNWIFDANNTSAICIRSSQQRTKPDGTGFYSATNQKYDGLDCLECANIKNATGPGYIKQKVNLERNHLYYVQRIYQVTLDYGSNPKAFEIEGTVRSDTTCSGTGYCVLYDAFKNPKGSALEGQPWNKLTTIESVVFRMNETKEAYIKFNFEIKNRYIYTDSYMLIDMTNAFGSNVTNNIANTTASYSSVAQKMQTIIGADYFDGRKLFSKYQIQFP